MTPYEQERQEQALQAVEKAFQRLQEIADENRIAYNKDGFSSHYAKLQHEYNAVFKIFVEASNNLAKLLGVNPEGAADSTADSSFQN
jgi:hypothetical protein